MDDNLTIEQVNDGLTTAGDIVMYEFPYYCDEVDPAINACVDILDMFEALGARTVGDIMRMLKELEEVL